MGYVDLDLLSFADIVKPVLSKQNNRMKNKW